MANNSKSHAQQLARHYFALLAEKADVHWDSDTHAEIDTMIEYIIDAALVEIQPRLSAIENAIAGLTEQLDHPDWRDRR
jgi:hypothetical protein